MRIAIISDIHGNALALEAVMLDIRRQRVDMVLNLGDIVSGPLDPAGTADMLMAERYPTIRGNHERWIIEDRAEARGVIDTFAGERLTAEHRDWIERMPALLAIEDKVLMTHGTPSDDTAPWLDNWWQGDRETRLPNEEEVSAQAVGYDYPVMLCGHTHLARAVRLRDGRLIVNPGAVGLQIMHGSPDARYAIIEHRYDEWSASLIALPYDHQSAARQAEDNGFPQWAEALTTGWAAADGLF